jgi:hypothetical protein
MEVMEIFIDRCGTNIALGDCGFCEWYLKGLECTVVFL